MSNIIPTLGSNKKSTDAPGKARPNISKLISDDIFIENEFDLSCLMSKIPKKQSVLEKGKFKFNPNPTQKDPNWPILPKTLRKNLPKINFR